MNKLSKLEEYIDLAKFGELLGKKEEEKKNAIPFSGYSQ